MSPDQFDEWLRTLALLVGLKPGSRLSSAKKVSNELRNFFRCIELLKSKPTGQVIADALNAYGVLSANGNEVSGSHVSNCRRKSCGIRQVGRKYGKPNYKNRNHITCAKAKGLQGPSQASRCAPISVLAPTGK